MANILIVDDERLVCEMLEVCLSRAGHTVKSALDGKQAATVIKKSRLDLAIIDIVMPERDGFELMMQLREEHPDLKVIAISGGPRIGNTDFLAMATGLGACKTFGKPLDSVRLLEAVNECLGIASSSAVPGSGQANLGESFIA